MPQKPERGQGSPLSANALRVLSAVAGRAQLSSRLGTQFGGKRDMYEVLGYAREPQYSDYRHRYDRQDIAGRIVDAPTTATWRRPPVIKEDDDENHDTAFEKAWSDLTKRLPVYHYLERVDKLAGVGQYAILLLGVRGHPDLAEPLVAGALTGPQDVLYLAPYSQVNAEVNEWETDPASPRFGKPKSYRIKVGGDLQGFSMGGSSQQTVHHSRVIHVADGLLEDDVFGQPRLQRVLNRLDDLEKVVGGGAEMFWVAAYRGLHANLDAEGAPLDPEILAAVSEEIDAYIHGLRRVIQTQGVDINPLIGETANPEPAFNVILSLISGATGIPKRILLGSEQGELASSQDETNWNARIAERQTNFAEPQILRPLIDTLIYAGALPGPVDGYTVEWPNLFALDEVEQADVALKRAQAIQAYAPYGETDRVVSPGEFREWVGLEPEVPQGQGLPDDEPDEVLAPDEFIRRIRSRLQGGDAHEADA